MTKGNGLPCEKCGTSEWHTRGNCKECARRWKKANPDKVRKSKNKWQRANPEGVRRGVSKWQSANREKMRENSRLWSKNNPEKNRAKFNRYRTQKTGAGGNYTAHEWKSLCRQYDNRCLACGKKKKLTADHVIPVSKGGTSDISNIQPLCKSCNSIKHDKTTDYRTKPDILRWIQKKLL